MSKEKAATQEAAANPAKGAAAPVASAAQYMYIGPNRLKEGLKTYQVFIGMPEDLLSGLKEKYPHIGRLFVAVGKLNETMAALGKKGTPVNLAYAEILEVK